MTNELASSVVPCLLESLASCLNGLSSKDKDGPGIQVSWFGFWPIALTSRSVLSAVVQLRRTCLKSDSHDGSSSASQPCVQLLQEVTMAMDSRIGILNQNLKSGLGARESICPFPVFFASCNFPPYVFVGVVFHFLFFLSYLVIHYFYFRQMITVLEVRQLLIPTSLCIFNPFPIPSPLQAFLIAYCFLNMPMGTGLRVFVHAISVADLIGPHFFSRACFKKHTFKDIVPEQAVQSCSTPLPMHPPPSLCSLVQKAQITLQVSLLLSLIHCLHLTNQTISFMEGRALCLFLCTPEHI